VTDDDNGACGCKVGRVAAEYGLSEVDARLRRRWLDGESVRDLAAAFNEDVVAAALSGAGVGTATLSAGAAYRALATDEASDADELAVRRELERAGVDAEALTAATVSHQTVYRHLTGCLDVERESSDPAPAERRATALDTVHALRGRTARVAESTVERLRSAGVAPLGDPEVLVDVRVVCRDCGDAMAFEAAIDGGCGCPDGSSGDRAG